MSATIYHSMGGVQSLLANGSAGCHVMQQECFASPEIASILNASFIPIKLDREARPDLDEIYMNYVTATTGSGGWPLSLFLTPSLDPVFGGTYWPGPNSTAQPRKQATSADDTPLSFREILEKMREIWHTQQARCTVSAKDATSQLRNFVAEGMQGQTQTDAKLPNSTSSEPLDLDLLDDALTHFISRYDAQHGGFSPASPSAPKFPTAPNLAFLLRIGASITTTSTRFGFPAPVPPILGKSSCANAATMALHTLLCISRSGLRDHLGHGFHRYSVTSDWNLPHFEKMLYDNAQLLSCYCDAFALSHDPEILGTIYSLVEYFTAPDAPIANPSGGFYSSEDADSKSSHGTREGAFYVWTFKEFQTLLGDRDASVLARHFGVKSDGSIPLEHDLHDEFLGQNVLHIAATPSVLAKEFGLPESEIVQIIRSGRNKLAAWRNKERAHPTVDKKVIVSWNALAISALARAANTLAAIDTERSERCRSAALNAADFIQTHLYDSRTGSLQRFYFAQPSHTAIATNTASHLAFLDDYAYLTTALLWLYDLTSSPTYLRWATLLQSYLDTHFGDLSRGGYFQVPSSNPSDGQALREHIVPLKPGTDTALPSPNAAVAMNCLYLSSYLGEGPKGTYGGRARRVLDAFAVEAIQHPFLFVGLLGAVVLEGLGCRAVYVTGEAVDEGELRRLNGWGRTVVWVNGNKLEEWGKEEMEAWEWLVEQNETVRSWKEELGVKGKEKARVLICESGRCRELIEGELDRMDEEYKDEDGPMLEGRAEERVRAETGSGA